MGRPLRTVLCGVGGYGEFYVDSFFDRPDSPLRFVGFVDPAARRAPSWPRIEASGVPVYDSLDAFFQADHADLAIVSSPIQFHAPQTIEALAHGCHVLCEKPLCATVQEAQQMLDAQRAAGRIVAIGYQDSYAGPTTRLKADIAAGVWGRPVLFKCFVQWPRSLEYYGRNRWAGRIRDDQGHWVLDSPVNNATAHYLHHMLYLLGPTPTRGAEPAAVAARLARGHAIENYDTAIISCRTTRGADVLFVTTHLGARVIDPTFELVFEKGIVRRNSNQGDTIGQFADGTTRDYGRERGHASKVAGTIAAIAAGVEPACPIEAAVNQTLCMNAAQESGQPIVQIPADRIRPVMLDRERCLEAVGLEAALRAVFEAGRLTDESAMPWPLIAPPRPVDLAGYVRFPRTG